MCQSEREGSRERDGGGRIGIEVVKTVYVFGTKKNISKNRKFFEQLSSVCILLLTDITCKGGC